MKDKIQNIYSLSPLQEGILYELEMNHSQTENLYVSQIQIKITGELELDNFLQAYNKVVKRHEALRTKIFSEKVENNVQVVFNSIDYQPEIIDLSTLNNDKQLDEIDKISLESREMDVNNSNLMALQLLKIKENQYIMIWTHHHIILDGWSTSIVIDEIFEIYNQFLGKKTRQLIDKPKQFSDFIRHMKATNKEDLNNFWQELVKDINQPTITFPSRQVNKINEGNSLFWEIETSKSKLLREFASENHVTLNVLLQLIWSIVLKQMSNQNRIVYGTVSSGRTNNLLRAEEIVGLLINTVPVVIEIKNTYHISDLLKNLHETLNDILEYSQISLADIKKYTNLGKNDSLFETLFVYENYPEATSEGYGIQWEVQNGAESHSYPVSLQVQDHKDTIKCKLLYNENFMESHHAKAIKETFQQIASEIINVQFVEDLNVKAEYPLVNRIEKNHEIKENDLSNPVVNEELRKIWIEFFGREDIDGDSDFFQLGGHSILAMNFVSKVNKQLNANLKLSDLFENPKLKSLSHVMFPDIKDESKTIENVLLTVENVFKEVLGVNQVDREMDFFEMGGHSISAMKLLSKLNKKYNDILKLKDIFQKPTVHLLYEHIVNNHLNIKDKPQVQQENHVLSSNQEALWFDEKFNGKMTHYNIPQKYIVFGNVEVISLEKALNQVINRHEILRTIVREKDGKGYQVIKEGDYITIDDIDLSEIEREKQQFHIQKMEEEMQSTIFDLDKGPLLSIKLVKLSEKEYILFTNHHHFIFDGWSVSIFLDEWLSFYESEINKEEPVLNDDFIQYKDFALEQKKWLEDNFEEEIFFWRNNLSGKLPKLQLPLDKKRPKDSRNRGDSFIVELSNDNLKKLKSLSLESESTLFMTLLTLYQSFLASYTGQEEIIVGSPLANRMMQGTEGSIGYFVNTLPFRLKLESGQDFVNHIKRNTEHIIDVYEHQQMPLEKITEAINPERNLENSSLFQTVFILQNNEKAKLKSENFELYPEIIKSNVAKFDLSLAAEEYQDKLLFAFEYNSEIFKESTIRSLSESFLGWIQSFISQPELSIDSVPIVNKKQEKILMEEWQGESILFEGINGSIPQAFYKIVEQYPDKVAIVDGATTITYRELNIMSNRMAHYLLKQGVSSEEKIGIYMDRSIDMIVGILAVIKAGAAYVPLDPYYPMDRLRYMIQDSSISFCLSHKELGKDGLLGISNMIYLEDIKKQFDVLMDKNLDLVNENNLAYIIYTSGTTGRPKGVMIEHKGVINLVFNQKKMMQFDESAKMLQFATINFDSSVIEIFSSLLFGAELYIGEDKENIFDINQLVSQIKTDRISHIILPPAVLKELPINELKSLKAVGSAGSECPVELVSKFKHLSFFNGYGPTECTVGMCFKLYPPNEDTLNDNVVPIGKPMSNTDVFVMNQNKKLVPIGAVGELYIGGPGLARGYLNNEKLTKEKFIPNPFNPSEKLYRTGDLVKFNSNGELIYIGRADNQVKIRGYRVELAEVNFALNKLSGVKDSFTVINEDSFQNKKITAFYIADGEISISMMREQLKGLLPDFMIPSEFIKLDKLPLTSNGKVDQEALMNWSVPTNEPEKGLQKVEEFTETEMILVEIWRKVLDNPSIGPEDNFFDCGGDSIISIQICSAAKEKQISITPKNLFEYQTVRELASIVNDKDLNQVVQEKVSGNIPLTPIQSWFFNEEHDNIHHWNQSIVLVKDNDLSTKQYEKILNKIIDHHDSLKTLFKKQNGTYIGEIHGAKNPFNIIEYNVESIYDEKSLQEIEEFEEKAQRSLNIYDGPMMNFILFRGEDAIRIFWVIHHLVVDGVSWRILLEDFERCYQQLINNDQNLFLTAKTTSYKEWSEKLREYESTKLPDDVIRYWEKELNKPISPIPENLGNYSDMENMFKIEINETKTQKLLKNTLRKYKSTIDELLLSIIAHVFSKQIGLDKFWVDLEGHGRESIGNIDLTRTVGWFTSMYPVRLNGESTIGLSLKNTKNIIRNIPNKGFDYGILKYISQHNNSYPESIISYNYLGQFNDIGEMENTNSSNIDLNYKFPYKFNFVSSIVNGKFNLNIIGDSQNMNFISICNEIKSQIINVLEENVELNHSIIETDFSSEKLVDKRTISHFIDKFNNIEEIYPVTPLQEGMLFHSEVSQSTEYISQLSFDLKGNVRLNKLEEAWNDTCQNYDVLRSVFKRNHVGDRYQVILSNIYYGFDHIDLTNYSGLELEEKIEELLVKLKEREIDIENGPLMNIMLFKLSSNHYKFIWTHHHVLIDGWSLQIVMNHFMNRYQNNLGNLENGEKQKHAYKQFLNHMRNVDQQKEVAFWKEELKNFKHGHTLFNKQKDRQHSELDKVIEYSLSENQTKNLMEISKQYRKTINTVVQGIWGIALSHFSESKAVCYGVTSSGRNNSIPNIESTVGLLINTQPFSIEINSETDLLSYFSSIQDKQLKMREYEFSSLTDIKNYADIPWNKELFEQIFVFENYPSKEELYESEIRIENSEGDESTNFDLTFSAAIIESKLYYKIIYKDGIYDKKDIIRFMDVMETMFTNLTKETITIGDIINKLKVGVHND